MVAELGSEAPGDILDASVPPAIRQAYGLDETTVVQPLGGGHVNDTLLITSHGERSILQKQSSILNSHSLHDAMVVSRHLIAYGWEAPIVMPTVAGSLWANDDAGRTWRRQAFIESDGTPPHTQGTALLEPAGDLLGRWHRTTQALNYQPSYGLAHFHDTDYFALRLTSHMEELPKISQQLGTAILQYYQQIPTTPQEAQQLIHGDPKFDNMLFRDGQPFTLVDFDTLMVGSPWLDMGDMLRSLLRDQITHGETTASHTLQPTIAAYHEASSQPGSLDYSWQQAVTATGRIALELGMRYLCDTVEASYFSWDSEQYDSRHDHHHAKAQLQLQIAQLAIDSIR